MSPQPRRRIASTEARLAVSRMAGAAGTACRDERLRRHLTLREVADLAGVSAAAVQDLESGSPQSLETYARVSTALGLRPELLVVPRRRQTVARAEDPVHAAMGEVEAARLGNSGIRVMLDEPYQHYQFAGRADVVAWDLERRALLHIENRTRFPNLQDAFGSYNAKRAYLPAVLADRLLLGPQGWTSVTNVIVALWSSEVLHVLRLRTASFTTVCPDPPVGFAAWWSGSPPTAGVRSELIVLDPAPRRRQPTWIGLEEALSARTRYRGYAGAVRAILETS